MSFISQQIAKATESLFVSRLSEGVFQDLFERDRDTLHLYYRAKIINGIAFALIIGNRIMLNLAPDLRGPERVFHQIFGMSFLASKIASDIFAYKMGLQRSMLDLSSNTYRLPGE